MAMDRTAEQGWTGFSARRIEVVASLSKLHSEQKESCDLRMDRYYKFILLTGVYSGTISTFLIDSKAEN